MNATIKVFSILMAGWLAFGAGVAVADGHSGASKPTVLITGANRGLGLEFARQYAADGWNVIGTARKPDRADDLKATGARVLKLDVTDRDSIDALAQSVGNESIDLLINNAGIFPRQSAIADLDIDDYTRTLAVNTVGPVLVTQALLPSLEQGDKKLIVNITSRLASIEYNESGGFYGYRESKTALNMFTKSLAAELGPKGFICLALHPAWVATDMGGPSAPLTPEESVSGMRAVIGGLTADDNGGYRSYQGDVEPW